MSTSQQKRKVLHTTNRFNEVVVKYEGRPGEVLKTTIKVDWYFAIWKKDRDLATQVISQRGLNAQLKEDEKFPEYLKVFYNPDRSEERYFLVSLLEENGVETFEGDLLLDRRWYIDKEVLIADDYRKLYFDIETDDTEPKIEVGKHRILSWAAVDNKGKKYFSKIAAHTDEAEKEILEKFLKTISKYDILLGWNSKGFDVPYLKMRMRRYDLHKTKAYCWNEVAHFDLLKRFRHIFRFDSHIRTFSLDFVAHHFLDKGKVVRTERVIDLWNNNQDKLETYNIEDSVLVKELDEKLGVSQMMIKQSQWCGVPVAQFGLYSIIDAHIMKTAHRLGKFVKTSMKAIQERNKDNVKGNENPDDTDTDKAKYAGAIVLTPLTGKYENVQTFDFKGLYPSMMRTSNIGYDTLRYEHSQELMRNPGTGEMPRKAGGWKPTYFTKEKSVINVAISELITKRSEYKKLKLKMIEDQTNKGPEWERVVSDEIIVKELANSTYGIMGLEYGRYFSIDIAESITLFGQWCILFAKKFFEDQGFPVIYGDTDSVFVVAGKKKFDPHEQLDRFHTHLKEVLRGTYGMEEVFIELEIDKKYETLILIEKKTYVGHVTNIEGKKTDEIYARGLEFIKKNTFGFAAVKQKALVEYLLHENPTKDQMREYLKQVKEDFYQKKFSKDELMITQRVGKPLNSYTKTPPLHVRLAQGISQLTGEDFYGNEVEYIITHAHPGKPVEGTVASLFDGGFDRDYYWTNKTQPLLERIVNVVYPGTDFFSRQRSLFE